MPPPENRLNVQVVDLAYWVVTINNPPINLYDPEMFAELRLLMDRIETDPNLKIVVFESADPEFFVAHYDVVRGREIPSVAGAAPFHEWPGFVTRLAQSRVVSVAKIRGRARGHGSELALACDIRFASREKAIFGQIEVALGVVPGGGATEWLSQLTGRSRALEILVGADDFDADTAERYGWINRAVPDVELDDFVEAFARRVATFDSHALELAKKSVNARAGFPSEAERWASNQAFLTTTTWQGVHETAVRALNQGLQQRGDYELRLGHHLAELHLAK